MMLFVTIQEESTLTLEHVDFKHVLLYSRNPLDRLFTVFIVSYENCSVDSNTLVSTLFTLFTSFLILLNITKHLQKHQFLLKPASGAHIYYFPTIL